MNDKHGLYSVEARWIDAWAGGASCVAGYSVNELRRYEDGTVRVKHKVKYLSKHPKDIFAHSIFMRASSALGVF